MVVQRFWLCPAIGPCVWSVPRSSGGAVRNVQCVAELEGGRALNSLWNVGLAVGAGPVPHDRGRRAPVSCLVNVHVTG